MWTVRRRETFWSPVSAGLTFWWERVESAPSNALCFTPLHGGRSLFHGVLFLHLRPQPLVSQSGDENMAFGTRLALSTLRKAKLPSRVCLCLPFLNRFPLRIPAPDPGFRQAKPLEQMTPTITLRSEPGCGPQAACDFIAPRRGRRDHSWPRAGSGDCGHTLCRCGRATPAGLERTGQVDDAQAPCCFSSRSEPSPVTVTAVQRHLAFLPSACPATSANLKDVTPEVCVSESECCELLFLFSPQWGVGPEDMPACGTWLPLEVASKATLSHSLATPVEPSWNK